MIQYAVFFLFFFVMPPSIVQPFLVRTHFSIQADAAVEELTEAATIVALMKVAHCSLALIETQVCVSFRGTAT